MDQRKVKFNRFCTMIDCSRNAVMNVPTVKRWIHTTADLGYNSLMLYTEETYELNDNPYFGYMRGRYTKEELKEIDRYAKDKGMELIPCIQTLAHLKSISRWPAYRDHFDSGDTLLVGDEFVYELIDKMFETLAECFTTRLVNIGLDEATIGRGKYYDLHGEVPKKEILLYHINRVAEIGKKHGFKLAMWSDIFYRLLVGGEGEYNTDVDYNPANYVEIPDNVELIFWNYWQRDKNFYDKVIKTHKQFTDKVWFAGGAITWEGFAPHNKRSMLANEAALSMCEKNGVEDVIITLWGDHGAECSKFSVLPAVFHASELAKGNRNMGDIKRRFKEKYGVSFDKYMNIELPDTPRSEPGEIKSPEKYLLYNDLFQGLFDTTLIGNEGERYKKCARKLATMKNHPEFGLPFATLHGLCEVLAVKANLGNKIHNAYSAGDTEKIAECIDDIKLLIKKYKVFYKAFRKQWLTDNKGNGFDVQAIRIGGLIQRAEDCFERLSDYKNGKIDHIEELEEVQLDIRGREGNPKGYFSHKAWDTAVTVSVL